MLLAPSDWLGAASQSWTIRRITDNGSGESLPVENFLSRSSRQKAPTWHWRIGASHHRAWSVLSFTGRQLRSRWGPGRCNGSMIGWMGFFHIAGCGRKRLLGTVGKVGFRDVTPGLKDNGGEESPLFPCNCPWSGRDAFQTTTLNDPLLAAPASDGSFRRIDWSTDSMVANKRDWRSGQFQFRWCFSSKETVAVSRSKGRPITSGAMHASKAHFWWGRPARKSEFIGWHDCPLVRISCVRAFLGRPFAHLFVFLPPQWADVAVARYGPVSLKRWASGTFDGVGSRVPNLKTINYKQQHHESIIFSPAGVSSRLARLWQQSKAK
ncbi:hypothetical protein QBC43DRAFT_350646 [Cladorrhinum sp. PSN259]|nr:hypothetical protein QBC43DRAFT_350646 [Cladorrhinum sp. PSN259]